MTTTVALLSVPEIANDLNITPVEVSRLIARGSLTATRLGPAGEYRVTVGNLEKYVGDGAVDLRLPEPASGAMWFTDRLSYLAGAFEQTIRDSHPTPSDQELKAAFARADQAAKDAGDLTVGTSLDFEILPTGPVADVMRRAVPASIYGRTPTGILSDSRFSIWSDLWAVDSLRSATLQVINKGQKNPNGFATLYDGPSSYQTLTAAGYALAASRTISYRKSVNGVGLMGGAGDLARIATFSFRVSNILSTENQQRLIDLAF